jgi:Sec-independent protein translocase protein TatA
MRPRTVLLLVLVVVLLFAPKVITGVIDQAGATAKQSVCGAVR